MDLTVSDILLIINLILTTLIPPFTLFFSKIRKSSCVGRCIRCGVERDPEESLLIDNNDKKNGTSEPADTSIINEDTETSFKRKRLSQRVHEKKVNGEVSDSIPIGKPTRE